MKKAKAGGERNSNSRNSKKNVILCLVVENTIYDVLYCDQQLNNSPFNTMRHLAFTFAVMLKLATDRLLVL